MRATTNRTTRRNSLTMSRTTLIKSFIGLALAFTAFAFGPDAFAQAAATQTASSAIGAIPALTVQGGAGNGQTYSLTLQVLLLMTALTLLPAIVLMMTSFTRIVIVLGILRQALGAGQTPPNQVLVGLSLFLSLFVMSPVIEKVNTDAIKPYMAGQIETTVALERAVVPLKKFMLDQTRESDIATFVRISGGKGFATRDDVPLSILVPAFVTSELKTAFLIGFLIFIPFVIIDLVVASVLMSMGMMMLSPVLISLPFKLMLFVLVDGWSLVMGTLAASFYR
jgi:flagellar biosynthetic protein FliP